MCSGMLSFSGDAARDWMAEGRAIGAVWPIWVRAVFTLDVDDMVRAYL